MEQQWDLFDDIGNLNQIAPQPVASQALRLNKQQKAIVERLREGPAMNMDLIPISTRFSARIHILRMLGFQIETKTIDRAKGLTLYTLKSEPE